MDRSTAGLDDDLDVDQDVVEVAVVSSPTVVGKKEPAAVNQAAPSSSCNVPAKASQAKRPVIALRRVTTTCLPSQPAVSGSRDMMISISKTNSELGLESTEVNIVIPSSSDSSLEILKGGSPLATSSMPLRKKTARKTLSSFTPMTQASLLARKRVPEVITVEDSDEDDEKTPTPSSSPIKRFKPEPVPCSGTNKQAEESPIKSELVAAKVDPDGKAGPSVEGRLHLRRRLEEFLEACKLLLTEVEAEKVRLKLFKRLDALPRHLVQFSVLSKFLEVATSKVRTSGQKLVFLHIKEVLDELKKNTSVEVKSVVRVEDVQTEAGSSETAAPSTGPPDLNDQEEDKKNRRTREHIKRLEKALEKCSKAIRKHEQAELSLDDLEEEDSSYLQVSRYKAKYMQIYRKVASLKKLSASLERNADKRFRTQASRIMEVNHRIEEIVNRQKRFPDFQEVLCIFEAVNRDQQLGLSSDNVQEQARATFTSVGKSLQVRRVTDELDVLYSYTPQGSEEVQDPAEHDPELKQRLADNFVQGERKLNNLLEEFVTKQNEEPEAEEPGYNSCSEDPDESVTGAMSLDANDRCTEDSKSREDMSSPKTGLHPGSEER